MGYTRPMVARKRGDSYSRFPMSFGDAIAALFRPKPKRKKEIPAPANNFPVPEAHSREVEERNDRTSVVDDFVAQRTD